MKTIRLKSGGLRLFVTSCADYKFKVKVNNFFTLTKSVNDAMIFFNATAQGRTFVEYCDDTFNSTRNTRNKLFLDSQFCATFTVSRENKLPSETFDNKNLLPPFTKITNVFN